MSSNTRTLRVIVVGNASQAARALRGLSGDMDRTGSRATATGSRLASAFATAGRVAVSTAAVAATALAGFTYKVGATYEQSLNKIGALGDLTDAQLAPIAQRLESQSALFSKYGYTSGDAAAGVVELVKAGQTLDQAMQSLNGTLVLAKAGELSVADASALAANTLNTFKMGAGEASHVANSLANAANASSANVDDLRLALAMTGLAAHQAGLDIDQTNAYLAILHNNGMRGSDAGTSLKTMLLRLTSGMGPVNAQLEKMGIAVYDGNGSMRSMQKVIKEFLPALDKLTDEERAKALYKIFGSDSIRAANAIFGEGSKKIAAVTEQVKKAGTAERFAASATKGLSGAFARGKAMAISYAQSIYRQVSPALASLANKGLDAAQSLKGKVGPALKSAFANMGGGGGGKELAKTGNALKNFGASMMPTLKKIGSQVMAVLGPALKDIGGIIVGDLLPAFREFLPAVTPVAKFLLNILGTAVVGVLKGLVNVVKGVLNVIIGIIKVFTGLLTGDWGKAWEGLKQIFSGAAQAIWGAIQVWWHGSILALFRRIPMMLKGLWSKAWSGLKSLASRGVSALNSIMMRIIRIITWPYRQAFSMARSYVSSGWAFIRGRFSGGVGGVKAVMGRVIQVITYPYRQAFSIARGVVSGGWSAIRGFFSRGVAAVMGVVRQVPGKIKGAFTGAKNMLSEVGKDIVRGLGNGISAMRDYVMDKVNDIIDKIPKAVKKLLGIASPSRVMKGLGKWITVGLANGISDAPSVRRMMSVLKNIRDRIQMAFKDKKISSSQRDHLLDIFKRNEGKIKRMVASRLKLQGKLEKAEAELARRSAKLAALRDAKSSIVDGARSAARDAGSFMGVFSDEDSNSPAAMLKRFAKRLDNIRKFRANMTELRSRGLSRSLLEQVLTAGPDSGGAMAAALMRATSGQLASMNSIGSSIEFESVGLGTDAGATYNAEIRTAQASVNRQTPVVNHIKVEVKGHVTAEKELAKAISNMVREEIERTNKRNGKK